MAAGVLLVLLVLAATFDAVVAAEAAPASGDPTTTPTPPPAASDADPSSTSATAFLHGPAPEAQALGGAPRLQDDSVDEEEDDDDGDDDEEYDESDADEYVYDEGDEDAYEDPDEFEYEDGGEGDEVDDVVRGEEEYEDEDYGEDNGEDAAADESDGSVAERTAGAAAAAKSEEQQDAEEEKVIQDAVVRERRAEVRSLSDLPLAKLLRVQTELRRLTGHSKGKDQCDSHKKRGGEGATRRWTTGAGGAVADKGAPSSSPNAQPLNWGAASRKGIATSTSTQPTVRRRGGGGDRGGDYRGGGDRGGGWNSHEEWEEDVHEEEEEEGGGGWISWDKGHKKKGKGDIGSIFHISVTFLAFLAFGGYLLCLIMQAVKGNGYYGYGTAAAQGSLRPAPNVMMVMMPTRAVTRRPTRPAGTGRRRRDAAGAGSGGGASSWRDWVPTLGEEDLRLLPEMDVDRMHRALLVLAEGYASFYHKRYTSVQQ